MQAEATRLNVRQVSERAIALALVLEFAQGEWTSFSLLGVYDDDADFMEAVAERVNVANDKAFRNKLRKVVRELEHWGVLIGRMQGTHKEYFGEPAKQKNYWMEPGKVMLIRRGEGDGRGTPEFEAEFLLRRAYPKPEVADGVPEDERG